MQPASTASNALPPDDNTSYATDVAAVNGPAQVLITVLGAEVTVGTRESVMIMEVVAFISIQFVKLQS